MKKFFGIIATIAVFTLLFFSCSKENTPLEKDRVAQKVKISFNATSEDPSTKSFFGEKTESGYPTVWTNRPVNVSVNCKESYSKDAEVTPSSDGKTASFEVEFTEIEGDTNPLYFYAISPASSVKGYITDWSMMKFEVPAEQTPTMESVDEAAHIMGAYNETPYYYETIPSKVTLNFSHIAAYGKFSLVNFPESVTIRSIELSSDKYLVGQYMYPANENYQGTFEKGKILKINPSKISAESNADKVFWFAFLPVNLGGNTLTVRITTDAGVYVKIVNFPSGKGNFTAGKVLKFALNMEGVVPEPLKYKLVTDYAELTEGSEIVIGSTAHNLAMGVEMWSYPYRKTAAIVKSSDKSTIENPGDDVQLFTLKKGSADNTVMFECKNGGFAGKYIGARIDASPSSNYAQWQYLYNCDATETEKGISMGIHLEDNGDAFITPYNTESKYKYLSCDNYNSDFKMLDTYLFEYALAIYKLEGTGEGGEQLIVPQPEFHFLSGVNMPAESGGMYYVGNTMNLPASGGTYTVTYEIKYPAEEGEIQPQSGSVSWNSLSSPSWSAVTSNSVSGNTGTLTITLPENTSKNSRSAKMYWWYKYNKVDGIWQNECTVELFISQQGKAIK